MPGHDLNVSQISMETVNLRLNDCYTAENLGLALAKSEAGWETVVKHVSVYPSNLLSQRVIPFQDRN